MSAWLDTFAQCVLHRQAAKPEDAAVNAAIQSSVQEQDLYLDESDPHRRSPSSTTSSLTDLSDSEPESTSTTSSLTDLVESEDELHRRELADANSAIQAIREIDGDEELTQPNGNTNHSARRLKAFRNGKPRQERKARMVENRRKRAFERAVVVPFDLDDLKSRKVEVESRVYRLDELEQKGIQIVEWNGRDEVPIVSQSGTVIGLLSGRPAGQDWDDSMASLGAAMVSARSAFGPTDVEVRHRRGVYHAVNTGISLGGGSKRPGELSIRGAARKKATMGLRRHPGMIRLSGYTSRAFDTYAPNLSTFSQRVLSCIEHRHPSLSRPFKNSPFGTLTFNLGPVVCTVPHLDFKNLAWGWCSVTSFGNYDHAKSGFLVLWSLRIAVQFPAHSTIFIPSAFAWHSNTAIQEGEERMSITQYTSAGLFRWSAYGFRLKSTAETLGVKPASWWCRAHHMFSKVPQRFSNCP